MACVDTIKYRITHESSRLARKILEKSVGDVSKETKRRICLADTN